MEMKNKSEIQRNRHTKQRRTEQTEQKEIPEEVVELIISRVSVKSVLRCKCVCKAWYKILSSKRFTFMHLNNTHRRDSDSDDVLVVACLINNPESETTVISAVTVPTTTTAPATANKVNHQLYRKVLGGEYQYSSGPSNGIFCLYDYNEILLWNPAINDLKVVPPSNQQPCRFQNSAMEIISAELGFDPKTKDFKILHVWYDISDSHQHHLQLYTLATDSWKNLDAASITFNTYKLNSSSPRFTTNSKIGWLAFDVKLPVVNRQYKLCLFDVSNETFDTTPPIPTEEGTILSRNMRVFPHGHGGSIAVVLCRLPEYFGSFEIWEWNDLTCNTTTTTAQSTSWTKLWTISQLQHPFQRPLGLWGSFYLTLKRYDFMLYDLVNQEPMDLNQDVLDLVAFNPTMLMPVVYRESLIYVSDNKRAAC